MFETDGPTHRFLPAIASLIKTIEQVREKLTHHQGQAEQRQGVGDANDHQRAEVDIADPASDHAAEQRQADQQQERPLIPPALEPAQQPDDPDDIQHEDPAENLSGQCEHRVIKQSVRMEFQHRPPEQHDQGEYADAPAERNPDGFRQPVFSESKIIFLKRDLSFIIGPTTIQPFLVAIIFLANFFILSADPE